MSTAIDELKLNDTIKKLSRPVSETSRTIIEDSQSVENARHESRTSSSSSTLTDSVQTTGDHNPYAARGKGEGVRGSGDHPEHVSSSVSAMHADNNQETVITTIRATDVTLGLRRLPAGFYIVVHYSDLSWRTENKHAPVDDDTIEWSNPIPVPSDPSATVCLEVYGSFEFQPMLGAGEQLRKLTTTVRQLANHSTKDISFTFSPKDGDVVSPCSSILVTVRQRRCKGNNSLESCCSTTESRGELDDATDQGHRALSHFRKHGEKQDLEQSIREFERALDICPPNHLCRAAAQSNLAMAKFILCRVEDLDAPLDVPLGLYGSALAARPVGHIDRPSTLIQLATVRFARFENRRDYAEEGRAEALLREVMELSLAGGHEKRTAAFMLQLHARRRAVPVQLAGQISMKQDSISRLTNEDPHILSIRLLHRFERFHDLADLQRAIAVLQELVGSTLSCDEWYLTALGNLGVALSYRFQHLGELSDLEGSISTLKDSVDLTPHGDPDKPARLSNFGNTLGIRFECLGNLDDLENAIAAHRDAIDLTPHGDPDKPVRLGNLGNSFSTRFEYLGELSDLEGAISSHKDAVELTPQNHPYKPSCFNNLATSLSIRFGRLEELNDLENAISMFRGAVDHTPYGHSEKPGRLSNLGNSLSTRFECLGDPSDLEDAISSHTDATDLTPQNHPDKPARLNDLGATLSIRFKRFGQLDDIEKAISMFRKAVDLTPYGHPDRFRRLGNLGISLTARFEHLGEFSDLDVAISALENAVDLIPYGHPDISTCLSNLGASLSTRFEHLGKPSDLEGAISRHRDAIELTPHDHPSKPLHVNNLAITLFARFKRLGELSDLEDAISMHKYAINLTPDVHPHKPIYLNNLGNSISTRFYHLGMLSDLEDAISTLKDAVNLTPYDDPYRPGHLNNLGNTFRTRFERFGEFSDLESAILALRDAVHLTPRGHPDRPGRVSDLGNSFNIRFEWLGELSDVESAISMLRDVVDLFPDGHPGKPGCFTNLGKSLQIRFERLEELGNLEEAILYHRSAVDFTPHDHPLRPIRLSNLGAAYNTRFEYLNEPSDLGDAIRVLKNAVDLTPHDDPHRPSRLNNLGDSLSSRFRHIGELSDLQDAISMLGDAVHLTPCDHPHKPLYLSNLGSSFKTRFEHLGESGDLDRAISSFRDATDLTPHGHPYKPLYLTNLGNSFLARFEHLGKLNDLNDAISALQDAVHFTPHGHSHRPRCISDLGDCFRIRFESFGEPSNLEQAIFLYSHAACAPVGLVRVRFQASQNWISCARRIHHRTLLHAYSVAITLLPQLAWIGLPLLRRYSQLLQGADVVQEAAAAALDFGFPETAVEWLEQGRSIVWGELFQLRSSYEELASTHPDHARRLRELSTALDHASATREKSLSAFSEQTQSVAHSVTESLKQEVDRHRSLAIERDKLLQEIRSFPDFKQFLLHKEFTHLRASAHSGPVVILNAAESRCDALIVLANIDHTIHVPLLNFSLEKSTDIRNNLKGFLRGTRKGRSVKSDGVSCESLLSTLWKCVVKPVLDALAFSIRGDKSRIFWCPTGPFTFLPIHAAGFYDTEYLQLGNKIFDFVVSSYAPTLSILALSPSPIMTDSSDFRLLAVRQPASDGLSQLPGVAAELGYIKEVIENSHSSHTILLESSIGTVEEVLSLMKEADWVHFACHGIQDVTNPTNSGLCLAHERRLKLHDIITLSRPRCGLAFLSACQTAMGEELLSDEAIHIAAGMLFAGYGGVIGTMWSISDHLAPVIARDVYKQLFEDGKRPDYREAARALHEAVGYARESGRASLADWLPFVHVGL